VLRVRAWRREAAARRGATSLMQPARGGGRRDEAERARCRQRYVACAHSA